MNLVTLRPVEGLAVMVLGGTLCLWAGHSQALPPDDDVVVVIANHRWLPSDGEFSAGGDVTIYPGGVVTFRKGLTPDAAAKSFWDAVGKQVARTPCDPSHLNVSIPTPSVALAGATSVPSPRLPPGFFPRVAPADGSR